MTERHPVVSSQLTLWPGLEIPPKPRRKRRTDRPFGFWRLPPAIRRLWDAPDNREATAIHEAGHAIVSWIVGREVKTVELEPEEPGIVGQVTVSEGARIASVIKYKVAGAVAEKKLLGLRWNKYRRLDAFWWSPAWVSDADTILTLIGIYLKLVDDIRASASLECSRVGAFRYLSSPEHKGQHEAVSSDCLDMYCLFTTGAHKIDEALKPRLHLPHFVPEEAAGITAYLFDAVDFWLSDEATWNAVELLAEDLLKKRKLEGDDLEPHKERVEAAR